MRFSAIAAAALAAVPAVSAVGQMGFALGTKKADGSCKATQDYSDDFDALSSASGAKIVRGYAASDCDFAKTILPVAKSKGAKVVLGIWPDTDDSYKNDLAAITAVASQYTDTIYAVTVGSETLYRGNFTGDTLKTKISDVKSQLPKGVKVGTADSWNKYADGTADPIIGTADILLINAFAFWQGAAGDNATSVYLNDMFQAIAHIEQIAGGYDKMPEVWNGETGWPTAVGTDYGNAKGGNATAASFYKQGFCALVSWGYNAFYFEAFDEPWKPASVGDNGQSADETAWGAFFANRTQKFDLHC